MAEPEELNLYWDFVNPGYDNDKSVMIRKNGRQFFKIQHYETLTQYQGVFERWNDIAQQWDEAGSTEWQGWRLKVIFGYHDQINQYKFSNKKSPTSKSRSFVWKDVVYKWKRIGEDGSMNCRVKVLGCRIVVSTWNETTKQMVITPRGVPVTDRLIISLLYNRWLVAQKQW
ncbi:hypothetical protein SISNIDRAFT_481435 [Sistotremastrum niveocremeum HHB9708]|uniref:Uncharacterized protein n=1 Tax=Sistotremastrum niveocremeum HHB9708 TaxID=1314777 RepID=A0A164Z3N0_9AGAM|nr:hypothetical protein SISNIDRAFT_481435 [Sistotremastrum niveocremeum HHB9708]